MKGLPAAFVALIIGIIAAWIAYNQYKVARAKLNLDLFDKRHHIFQKTWECLSQSQSPEAEKLRLNFTNLIPEVSFIFGKNVKDYMYDINKKLIELNMLTIKLKSGNITKDETERITELSTWFYNEASIGSRKVFSEYLDFSKWK